MTHTACAHLYVDCKDVKLTERNVDCGGEGRGVS